MVRGKFSELFIHEPFLFNSGRIACEVAYPLVYLRVPTLQATRLNVPNDGRSFLVRTMKGKLKSLNSARFPSTPSRVFSFSADRRGSR